MKTDGKGVVDKTQGHSQAENRFVRRGPKDRKERDPGMPGGGGRKRISRKTPEEKR